MLLPYISQAGHIGILLVVLSVISVAIILERAYFFIRHVRRLAASRRDKLFEALQQGNEGEVDTLLKKGNCPEFRCFSHVWDRRHQKISEGEMLDFAVNSESQNMGSFFWLLQLIGSTAPMFGILGTVVGIISSFSSFKADSGAPDPNAMVGGISQAMLTTAMGLIVALTGLVAHAIFVNWRHTRMLAAEEFAVQGWQRWQQRGASPPPAPAKPPPADDDESEEEREEQ